MKKIMSFLLSVVFVLSVFAGCSGKNDDTSTVTADQTTDTVPVSQTDLAVADLRVNFEKEPVCIEGTPLFSWTMTSSKRGSYQRSYRIKVAESKEGLEGAPVWDSGTVASDASSCVEFGGTLSESKRYYWNVTVTDNYGAEVTSDASFFDTALIDTGFDGASWITENNETVPGGIVDANWIWLLNGDSQGNIAVKTEYFRKTFQISKKVTSAIVAYTADDYGKLYVNGRQVCEITEASGWQNAVSADITSLLVEGDNTVACSAVNNQVGYGAVLVKLHIVFDDGSTTTVVSDNSWVASEKYSDGWFSKDHDGAGFVAVNSVTSYGNNPWLSNVKLSGSEGSAPMMRRQFEVDGDVSSVRLFASAAGLYDAYINGSKAGNSVLDPGRSEYNKRVMYQCSDITDKIVKGRNVIGAMLGRGWYIGAYSPYGGTVPAFICKIVIDYKDGRRQTVTTDGEWTYSTDGPILYNDIFNGETYDARSEQDGWSAVAFDSSSWKKVRVTTAAQLGVGELVPQLSGTVKVMDRITAKTVNKIKDKKYIYDFGQNLAGVVSLKLKGDEGTVVTLRHAEMLNDGNRGSDGKAGTLYTANLRTAKATDKYTLKGSPDGETYTPTFTFHGFRYLEIAGLDDPLPLGDVTALVLYSDMEDTGKITTSDALINQLVSNTYWGQRGNFLSTPTDCPQRDERMGWSGDAQIFSGTAAYNMNVKAFFDKYITDLNDCQHSDGAYPDVAPGTGRANYGGAGNNAWGDAGVIIPWIMYTRYGDVSYIEKYYNNMKKYERYLVSTSGNYIRNRSAYGDWLSIGESTNVAVTDTAYCVYVADLMVKMAELLGKNTDAEHFRSDAEKFRQAWIDKFVSSPGKLKYDTQTAYLVALAFDIIPDGEKQPFADRLAERIKRNKNRLTTGFIGCPLLLPVLCEYGYEDVAFLLLQQEEYPSWKYPILQGATTIWERWNSYTIANGFGDAGMNSFNHYSYGSVTEWLYSTLCGIKCDENAPGFRHFFLEPVAGGGITSAECEYDSIKGMIRSAWTAESDRIVRYTCTVPGNTQATLTLRADHAASVTESGKALSEAEGVEILSEADGRVTLKLGSGDYTFEIK